MYEDINKRLSQSQKHLRRLNKVEAMIETLKRELSSLEEKSQSAKSTFEKENRDYQKIAQKNISSIFYSVLGTLEEKTKKERQEALEAELKYNQCIRDLEEVKTQISKLEAEGLRYKNAQTEYDEYFNEKFQILMRENGRTARDIMELNRNIELSKNSICEIDEAISAGHEVDKGLSAVMASLNSARDWGVWDMLGGGLITSMVKHSHIDSASDTAQQVQSALRRFRTELADIHLSEELQVEISGFARFADFFFDGLLADWFVQNKINTTQENVSAVQSQVQNVMNKLDKLKKTEQKTQDDLNTQLSMLVVKA